MSDIEVVLNYSKKIESILASFNARGRGLHEKVTSIENSLDSILIKKIRYIATIRNKVLHEDGFTVDNIEEYSKKADSVINELNSISLFSKEENKKMSNIVRNPVNSIGRGNLKNLKVSKLSLVEFNIKYRKKSTLFLTVLLMILSPIITKFILTLVVLTRIITVQYHQVNNITLFFFLIALYLILTRKPSESLYLKLKYHCHTRKGVFTNLK